MSDHHLPPGFPVDRPDVQVFCPKLMRDRIQAGDDPRGPVVFTHAFESAGLRCAYCGERLR